MARTVSDFGVERLGQGDVTRVHGYPAGVVGETVRQPVGAVLPGRG